MKLATDIRLSWHDGITIDGIKFPFYVGEDVEIEPGGQDALTVVRLPVVMDLDGVVILAGREGHRGRVIDGRNGDVAEWARRLVREGLIERIPWLELTDDRKESL